MFCLHDCFNFHSFIFKVSHDCLNQELHGIDTSLDSLFETYKSKSADFKSKAAEAKGRFAALTKQVIDLNQEIKEMRKNKK